MNCSKVKLLQGVMLHASNISIWKVKAGILWV